MNVVHIFLTNPVGDEMTDFEHGDYHFRFSSIDKEGPKQVTDGPILCFVDWVLPDMSGLEMCRCLRSLPATADAHITILLERDNPDDRRRAIAAGADNYIVGPVDRTVLLDRAMAIIPELSRNHVAQLKRAGGLTIDPRDFSVSWNGQPFFLHPNHMRLLRYFIEHPNELLSRRQVIEGLGKEMTVADPRTVDAWVKRLRRRLREAGAGDPLRTVRGYGYVFEAPE